MGVAGRDLGTDYRQQRTLPPRLPILRHHAGVLAQRQGRWAAAALRVTVMLASILSAPAVVGTAAAADAGASSTRERLLRDEQRQLEGRIQTLDRQLAPYDRDRLRSTSPGERSMPRVRPDPAAERLELERRNLRANERAIEHRLRQR